MVSEKLSRKDHKGSSKIPSHVPNEASNSGLKKIIKALKKNAHDSPLMESIGKMLSDAEERKVQQRLLSREKVNEAGKSGTRSSELRFINDDKLPITTFTKTNIITKDEALQVALFDVGSQSIVNEGPLSSMKVEICPIQGKFESCDDEDWTQTEFNHNIVHQRESKEPLLGGDRFISLKNGVGSISEIKFSDNSKWVKSGKFSLGAKAMKNGENIKEGISQPFRVKDIRGEAYKKHYPPYLKLKDHVWRLKKISKDGPYHKRLHTNKIHTVKDLLRLLITDESSLREKFETIPNKSWSDITEHARSCVVDDYMLYSYLNVMIGQPLLLLFNVIYELVGVTFDEQKFYLQDDLTLTPYQKNSVEIAKKDAYKNIENLKEIAESELNSISLEERIKSTQDMQGYGDSTYTISGANANDGMENVEMNFGPVADTREIAESSYVHSTENLINVAPLYTTPELDFDDLHEYLLISNSEKPKFKAVWCMVRFVVKWRISGRRRVAAASLEE